MKMLRVELLQDGWEGERKRRTGVSGKKGWGGVLGKTKTRKQKL